MKAKIMQNIAVAPAFVIAAKARMLAKDHDVIILTLGEPDFDIPEHIRNAAALAAQEGHNEYPPISGIPELKQAIVNKLLRDNGIHFEPSDILITNGVKQALYNIFMSTIDPGDEVIVPVPYWTSYKEMIYMARGVPIFCPTNAKGILEPAVLSTYITSKTKWLLLNYPNNPSGVVYGADDLKGIANVLIKKEYEHVHILTDEIYEYIIYDNIKFHNILSVAPELNNRVVVTNGLSKSYAMMGWRVGYMASRNKEIIDSAHILQSQSTSGVCTIAQYAALAAISGPQDCVADFCSLFLKRRNLLCDLIQEIPYIKFQIPEGAFYLLIDCRHYIGMLFRGNTIDSANDFVEKLLQSYYVALTPCESFGMPGFVRISYAATEIKIAKAAQRMREFCLEIY